MKKITLFVSLIISCVTAFPTVVNAIGLEGVGGKLAIVLPEDPMGTSIGLGVVGDLGTVVPKVPQLKVEPSVEYWGDSYEVLGLETSWKSISFNGTAKYHFPIGGKISPYAGGGLALTISRSSWESKWAWVGTSGSDTKLDIGLHLVGGADMPLSPSMKVTAELKYAIDGADTFEIVGASVFKLK